VAPGTSILDAYAKDIPLSPGYRDSNVQCSSRHENCIRPVPDAHQPIERLLARLRNEDVETKALSESETMN